MPPSSPAKKRTTVRTGALGWAALRLAMIVLGRLAPPLAARLASRLFLRTRRFRTEQREQQALEGARRLTLDGPAGPLPVWVWGSGPTVALVHGWEGRGSQLGGFAPALVAAGLRVVAFDAPGHGSSPGNSSSLVVMGRALRQVADSFGPLAGVVAHSAGAVATTWALSCGLPAARVVYIAPGSDLHKYARHFARFLGLSPRVLRLLQERVEREIGITWQEIDPRWLAPGMAVPLLVQVDAGDRETPAEDARALVREWPGAALRVTRGLGHFRILWDPAVIRETVGFLAAAIDLPSRPPAARCVGEGA